MGKGKKTSTRPINDTESDLWSETTFSKTETKVNVYDFSKSVATITSIYLRNNQKSS